MIKRIFYYLSLIIFYQGIIFSQVNSNEAFDSVNNEDSFIIESQSGSISGMVFYDMNGNGTMEPATDYGLGGWKIKISGPKTDSVFTDSNGDYNFSGLSDGTYIISEELQLGWVRAFPPSPGTHTVVISGGSSASNNNFGNWPQGIIRGKKFNDLNGNGIFDSGEPGLSDWIINAVGVYNSQTKSAVTDNQGNYEILGLIPDTYIVTESLSVFPGWVVTLPSSGYYSVQLLIGSRETRDFGNYKLISISGQKFDDKNGNGVKDGGDTGLEGWKIRLGGSKVDSATTDESGNYSFSNLGPGTYTLSEEQQTGWTQTTLNPAAINATSGTNVSGRDFGNFKLVSISGQKFHDRNGNGVKEAGEEGLQNWRIRLSGSKTDSVLTDSDGNYMFSNLGLGTYTLTEGVQIGWTQTTSNPAPVTSVSGTNISERDFGNYKLASISGQKFNDKNGNGIKEIGEDGLSGWKIRINGTKEDSATTDANGNYTIVNLPKGSYTISEVVQSGWQQTYPGSSTYSITIDTSSTVQTGKDFGNYKLGIISGQKFDDKNGNGVKDIGDTGLQGWKIRVSGVKEDSATTDAGGNYTIGNLPQGTYTVSEVLQSGWQQTYPAPPSVYTVEIDTSGSVRSGRDFGNFKLISISGQKFDDKNGNGIKDAGDTGLEGWKIRLGGSKVDSATTDASGNYTFNNLGFGTYTLSEEQQTGWQQTTANQVPVNAISGANVTGRDFGNYKLISISGQKFDDKNGNGVKDAGDTVLEGWKIRLGGSKVDSATTDASGNYTFSNLGLGTYTLSEDQQTGWTQTTSNPAPVTSVSGTDVTGKDFGNFKLVSISGQKFHDKNGNGVKETGEEGLQNWRIRLSGAKTDSVLTDSDGNYTFNNLGPGTYTLTEAVQTGWTQTTSNPAAINAASGTNVSDMDFGNYKLASISGQKFNDKNGNGIKDTGEDGLSGWKIRISGTKADSATTDADGNYTIVNLPQGTYTVSEVLQNGWQQTYPAASTYSITIDTSSTVLTGKDFGNYKLGIISGQKFDDKNGNRLKDIGDTGLQGWKIRVSGVKEDSATTDAGGNYTIGNLPQGTYTVSEVLQSGWQQTYPSATTYSITIDTSVSVRSGNDFGNFKLVSISGQKFDDKNGDGIKDAGDTGLEGWKIRLGGSKVDSATTDASGNYTFSNLGPGTYTLSEEQQTGWQQTTANPVPVNAISGANVTGRDFGNFKLISISGQKFDDKNGNGVKDAGDTVLEGWKIRLGGSKVDSATTDESGNYTFSNLGLGTYTLSEDQQTGWIQTTLNPAAINATSGTNVSGRDFGNFKLVSISGQKFHDRNGNGVKETGEEGLQNWRIRLSGSKTDSILTDSDGNYTFNNLGPGPYTLTEGVQIGWTQTTSNPAAINALSGTNVSDRDFGNYKLASISGHKFNDKNGNGIKDTGEDGLSGWKIRISGTKADSATTDADGNYTISNLPQGTYTVSEVLQNGWQQTYPGLDSSYVYNMIIDTSGTEINENNFGNYRLGIIIGQKFNDLNGNGIKDEGEPGLFNWRIRLSGTKIDSVLTDESGNYIFTNLPQGSYVLSEAIKTGWIQTLPSSDSSYLYHVEIDTSNTIITDKDFGNFRLAYISGKKFNDINGNGVKDDGEPGIENWKIFISGLINDSTYTDSNGEYIFEGMNPGKYFLHEEKDINWVATLLPDTINLISGIPADNVDFGNFKLVSISGQKFEDKNGNGIMDGGEEGLTDWWIYINGPREDSILTDSNGNYTFSNLGPGTYTLSEQLQSGWTLTLIPTPVTVTSGMDVTNKNFGNFKLGIVSGQKYHDKNGNGIKDSNENGIPGWKIYLSGTRSDTTETDSLGNFDFTDLYLGNYIISEQDSLGWIRTYPSGSGTHTITIDSSGQNINNKLFGNLNVSGISGRKFQDMNGDGVEDNDEPGLSGWIITLNGPTGLLQDTTDQNGNYSFTDLPAGNYQIWEEYQIGWIQTYPPQTSPIHEISLSNGEFLTGKNFGNFSLGIVEGIMFNDNDGNGVYDDGELQISGWGIYLKQDGNVIDSTSTDQLGRYKFIAVPPGLFTIQTEQRIGWISTHPDTSGSITDTMKIGGYYSNKNFGKFHLGSLTGQVYHDLNGNGIKDINEAGVSGWSIRLSGAVVDSTISDSIGYYSFGNLGPGIYYINEIINEDWILTQPQNNLYEIQMKSSLDSVLLNFGNYLKGSISGNVFYDMNLNGIKEDNEDVQSNWKVYLKYLHNQSEYEIQTDAFGNYKFSGLASDSFQVSLEYIHPWIVTNPSVGYHRIDLQPGENIVNANFATYRDTSKYRTFTQQDYSIKGLKLKVWHTPVPMPNPGNVRDSAYVRKGWTKTGFYIGIAFKDSSKYYGWARFRLIKQWLPSWLPATGQSRGFDLFNGRVWKGMKIYPKLKYHNNHLAGEQVALKLNIAASDVSVTPRGFSNLIYRDTIPNPCNDLTIRQIAGKVDTALTFWKRYPSSYFVQLDSAITKINRAFLGNIDTFSTSPLKIKGAKYLDDIYYLHSNPNPSSSTYISDESIDEMVPDVYKLYQNYPNPFNPITTIQFELPKFSIVTLKIYNILGQEVSTLLDNEELDEGIYEFDFDGSSIASGIYFYQLVALDSETDQIEYFNVKKMMLIK